MEPKRRPSAMPLPENLRPKQVEIIQAFETRDQLVCQLPVGYGKTRTAAGSFAQLMHRMACNRMLYIVPRINQARQAAEGLPEDLALFGIKTKALIVGEDRVHSLRSNASGQILVYVATIQSLLSEATIATIQELMSTCRWFVPVDEHHHYGTNDDGDSAWVQKLKLLNSTATLAMSATPKRSDRADHFPAPEVRETYRDAAKAGYVKRLSLHAYEYKIDTVTIDGHVYQLTSSQLAEEAGLDRPEAIDAYLTSKRMRLSPKYVSPLVTFPLSRMVDLRLRGFKAQMLIQAMSCAHAQCVVDQVRALIPEFMKVDWVGTGPFGRKGSDNEDVLKQFCPPKDKLTGKREWSLDILVNVGIAGEGLDSVDVTEISFLTPANITTSNLQTIGRGARVPKDCPTAALTAHINVDTTSEMASHIGKEVELLFDRDLPPPKKDDDPPREPGEPGDYEPLPEKLMTVVADVSLVEIRSEPLFQVICDDTSKDFQRQNRPVAKEEIENAAEKALRKYLGQTGNESAVLADKRLQVEAAARKVGGLVLRRIGETGVRVERTLMNDIMKRIGSYKKRKFGGSTNDLGPEELDRQYEWLKELERSILLAHGLSGLPSWLQ